MYTFKGQFYINKKKKTFSLRSQILFIAEHPLTWINNEGPKFKLGDHEKISKHKNTLAKAVFQIGQK